MEGKRKMTGVLVILGVVAILAVVIMVVLNREPGSPNLENVGTGGTKDETNYNAPKEIKSNDLVFFETNFFRYGGFLYEKDRNYFFKMTKASDDVYVISEGYDEKLKCETDKAFADKLNEIIKKYNLVQYNGVNKKTYGLPEEYSPKGFHAEYASGETLSFTMNNNPQAEWSAEVLDLYAREFGKHDIPDLLPPKENSKMTRFSIEYTLGDKVYTYGEIWIPVTETEKNRSFEDIATNGSNYDDCVKMAYGEVWDRTNKESIGKERRANITDEFYTGLQAIVEATELNRIQNGQIFPGSFDYDNAPCFYEFYIEYESGNRMSAFTDDASMCEKFKPVAEKFAEFFEDYLEKNKARN